MRTIKLLLVLPLAASLVFACTREPITPYAPVEETKTNAIAGDQIIVPFTAEAGATQTRVEMKDGNTTNIVFSAGDQLMVYNSYEVAPSILTPRALPPQKSRSACPSAFTR